jgi:hypothetical protein
MLGRDSNWELHEYDSQAFTGPATFLADAMCSSRCFSDVLEERSGAIFKVYNPLYLFLAVFP